VQGNAHGPRRVCQLLREEAPDKLPEDDNDRDGEEPGRPGEFLHDAV
jgi:hypothetical protein